MMHQPTDVLVAMQLADHTDSAMWMYHCHDSQHYRNPKPPQTNPRPNPFPHVPIDLGAVAKGKRQPVRCYGCGETSYIRKNCPRDWLPKGGAGRKGQYPQYGSAHMVEESPSFVYIVPPPSITPTPNGQ